MCVLQCAGHVEQSGYDDDDALFFLRLLNDASPDPAGSHEALDLGCG